MPCKPYLKLPRKDRPRAAAPPVYEPDQLAKLYGAPQVKLPAGVAVKLSLIELGGGFSASVINSWCDQHGYPHPTLTAGGVDGATNGYTGDPQSADVEVHLDICVAVGVVFAMTGGAADITVIFAPNSSQGFLDAAEAAAQLQVPCGISWGGPEDSQASLIGPMDAMMAAGNASGATYCCAAGDNGSSDGESGDHADYPGSSPYALCCGGTSIVVQGGKIVSETPWNDQQTTGDGATGGGYSAVEAAPAWQSGFIPAGKLRGVPDVAAAADPDADPWDVAGFGGVGGTSAVAPFMAAFLAVCRAAGWAGGLPSPIFYQHEADGFRDVVTGNNGDFSAGKGWDPASGLGAPILSALYAALVSGTPAPTGPTGPTSPTGPTGPTAPPPPPPPSPAGLTRPEAITSAVKGVRSVRTWFGEINERNAEAAVARQLTADWPKGVP